MGLHGPRMDHAWTPHGPCMDFFSNVLVAERRAAPIGLVSNGEANVEVKLATAASLT